MVGKINNDKNEIHELYKNYSEIKTEKLSDGRIYKLYQENQVHTILRKLGIVLFAIATCGIALCFQRTRDFWEARQISVIVNPDEKQGKTLDAASTVFPHTGTIVGEIGLMNAGWFIKGKGDILAPAIPYLANGDLKTLDGMSLAPEPGDYLVPFLPVGGFKEFENGFYLPGSFVRNLMIGDVFKLRYKDKVLSLTVPSNQLNFINFSTFNQIIGYIEGLLYGKNGAQATYDFTDETVYPHPNVAANLKNAEKLKDKIAVLIVQAEEKDQHSQFSFNLSSGAIESKSREIVNLSDYQAKDQGFRINNDRLEIELAGAGSLSFSLLDGQLIVYKTGVFSKEAVLIDLLPLKEKGIDVDKLKKYFTNHPIATYENGILVIPYGQAS